MKCIPDLRVRQIHMGEQSTSYAYMHAGGGHLRGTVLLGPWRDLLTAVGSKENTQIYVFVVHGDVHLCEYVFVVHGDVHLCEMFLSELSNLVEV